MKPPNLNLKQIPYIGLPDEPITSSSQDLVSIADIVDDLVIFKDGGAAIVMESTSLNFDLLSEKEQEAVIAAYAALLNSLTFPIQIIVRSQRKDISNYMKFLEEKTSEIKSQQLLSMMESYKSFINDSIKKKNVLGKRFFIVIPFSPLELGVTKTIGAVTKRKGPLPFTKSYVLKKAKVALIPKRDHLIRQSGRLGLQLNQLVTNELIELFYDIYNPEPPPKAQKDEFIK